MKYEYNLNLQIIEVFAPAPPHQIWQLSAHPARFEVFVFYLRIGSHAQIWYFRVERGLTSRSSGLGSTSSRNVLENFFTIQPSKPLGNRVICGMVMRNRRIFCPLLNFIFFLIHPFTLVYHHFVSSFCRIFFTPSPPFFKYFFDFLTSAYLQLFFTPFFLPPDTFNFLSNCMSFSKLLFFFNYPFTFVYPTPPPPFDFLDENVWWRDRSAL